MLGFGAAAAATVPIKKRVGAAEEAVKSSQFIDLDQPVDPPSKLQLLTSPVTGMLPSNTSGSLADILNSQGDGGALEIVWVPDLDFEHVIST